MEIEVKRNMEHEMGTGFICGAYGDNEVSGFGFRIWGFQV